MLAGEFFRMKTKEKLVFLHEKKLFYTASGKWPALFRHLRLEDRVAAFQFFPQILLPQRSFSPCTAAKKRKDHRTNTRKSGRWTGEASVIIPPRSKSNRAASPLQGGSPKKLILQTKQNNTL